MFENVQLQGIQSNNIGSTASAVMWIISPRRYSMQMKRPLSYNFSGQFIDQADSAIHKMSESQNPSGINAMVSSPQWLKSIFPNSAGHTINLDPLANSWTFLLIVNNDKSLAGGSGLVRSMSDNQHLYYGFFIDEPVNTMMHFGKTSFNPNAVMMITHKTLINKTPTASSYGQTHNISIMADTDVVHPHIMRHLTSTPTLMSRPEELFPAVNGQGDDVIVMQSESMLLANQANPILVGSQLSIPHEHVSKILKGVANARGSLYAAASADQSWAMHESSALSIGRDNFNTLVEQNITDQSRLTEMGLSIGKSVLFNDIISRYNPKIEVARQDLLPRYSPIDQQTTSARTIFSSMLTTVVPALMVEFKLVEIAFYYDSYHQTLRLFEEVPPAPIVPMHAEIVKTLVMGFNHRLVNEVLPILKLNHGDFVLQMNCSASSVTHITLNFLDDAIRTNEVFEVPTIFGGLNSSLISTAPVFDHNARELNHLISSLTDTPTDQQPALNFFDKQRYDQTLLAFDKNVSQPHNAPYTPTPNKWNI